MSNELEFILSDESVANSYGFHILTEGINLQRFNSNPVMLNNHRNDRMGCEVHSAEGIDRKKSLLSTKETMVSNCLIMRISATSIRFLDA